MKCNADARPRPIDSGEVQRAPLLSANRNCHENDTYLALKRWFG